jgi:hypothetical protein
MVEIVDETLDPLLLKLALKFPTLLTSNKAEMAIVVTTLFKTFIFVI